MKITPTIIPTAPRVETSAKLTVGRIISAIVGAQRADNLVELTAGRLKLLAESTLAFRSGDKIQLRVEGQDLQQRPLLRVLTPAATQATTQLKATLPKQESAALLLSQLAQLSGSKQANTVIQQAIATLNKLPTRAQVVTPASLKTVLDNSGLFLEANLGRGKLPPTDIKAELLRLVQSLQGAKVATAATSTGSAPAQTPAATGSGSATTAGAQAATPTLPGNPAQPLAPASSVPVGNAATAPSATPPATQGAATAPPTAPAGTTNTPASGSSPVATPAASAANSGAPLAGTSPAAPAPGGAAAAAAGTTAPGSTAPSPGAPSTQAPPAGKAAATPAQPAGAAPAAPSGDAPRSTLPPLNFAFTATDSARLLAGAGLTGNLSGEVDAAKFLSQYLRFGRGGQSLAEALPGQIRPQGRSAATLPDIGNLGRLIEALLGQTESTLARIESTQLLQVQSRDGQLPQWLFEIPVRDKDGVDILKFKVEREPDSSAAEASAKAWHITLSFDFPSTGPVIARVSQTGETVDVNFFAASSSTYAEIAERHTELQRTLAHRGIADVSLKLQHGLPEESIVTPGLQSMLEDSA